MLTYTHCCGQEHHSFHTLGGVTLQCMVVEVFDVKSLESPVYLNVAVVAAAVVGVVVGWELSDGSSEEESLHIWN
jgi:hypothetical protein